jgi:hypothetical protein
MIEWAFAAQANPHGTLSTQDAVAGMEIICEASALQTKVLQSYIYIAGVSEASEQSIAPFSYWILAGISQQLRHERWRLLQCVLPIMSLESLHEYALASLCYIEKHAKWAVLGFGMFLPLLVSMGIEMVSPDERRRVLALFDDPQAQWFGMAPVLRQTIVDSWALSGLVLTLKIFLGGIRLIT